MKQNHDVKQEATYRYSNMSYEALEKAFSTTNTPNGEAISAEEWQVLEIIAVTRSAIEPFRYQLWRNCPAYFEMLFGHEARKALDDAFKLYQQSTLTDMDDFKNWVKAELVNL